MSVIRNSFPFVGTALLAAFLAGCASKEKAAEPTVEPKPVEAPDANLTTIDNPALFKLATVTQRKEHNELSVNATVQPDVSRNVPVNALLGGRVVDVFVRLYDNVKKGQLLLTLTSPDMSAAISDYLKFQADEKLAKTQLEREQTLYDKGAVAQKDLEVAQDAYDKAKVDTQTAAEKIRLLGGSLQHLTPLIEVRAPVSGTIVEQNVTNAAGVKSPDNSPNLFTIADLSHVWVVCDVYENNLVQVHVGDHATVRLNAAPERAYDGRVSNIAGVLDPNTRTAKVRIDLANANGFMRPNMFATVVFESQGEKTRDILPVSAILRLQDRDWVFRKLGGKQFRRQEIQTGPATADGFQQILGGVSPGDQVAADALQFSRAIETAKEQGNE